MTHTGSFNGAGWFPRQSTTCLVHLPPKRCRRSDWSIAHQGLPLVSTLFGEAGAERNPNYLPFFVRRDRANIRQQRFSAKSRCHVGLPLSLNNGCVPHVVSPTASKPTRRHFLHVALVCHQRNWRYNPRFKSSRDGASTANPWILWRLLHGIETNVCIHVAPGLRKHDRRSRSHFFVLLLLNQSLLPTPDSREPRSERSNHFAARAPARRLGQPCEAETACQWLDSLVLACPSGVPSCPTSARSRADLQPRSGYRSPARCRVGRSFMAAARAIPREELWQGHLSWIAGRNHHGQGPGHPSPRHVGTGRTAQGRLQRARQHFKLHHEGYLDGQ